MKVQMIAGMIPLALSASLAHAQFTFDPAVSYPAGVEPSDVAIGDYNGDGFADLASPVDNPDRVELLFNNGDGTFTPGGSVILPNSSSPGDIVAGDLDGDTDIDLAVALKDNNAVIVLLNQGGGTFVSGGSFPAGAEPRGLSIGDHDGDLDLDLATANRDDNTATVLTNQGDATFASASLPAGNDPRGTAFGDFDGDMDLDLAVTAHDDRAVRIYTNNGGIFSLTTTLSVGSQRRPEGIVSADLNGDMLDDIAVATNGQNNALNDASVFVATGGGAFGTVSHYPTGGRDTSDIIAADFDCDEIIDLAASNADSNNISVLPNLGGGVFGAATILAGGTEPENLDAGDLDDDNVPDIAMANKLSGDVTVHINETCDAADECLTLAVNNLVGGEQARFEVTGAPDGEVVAIVYSLRLGQTVVSDQFGYCATFGLGGVNQSSLIAQGAVAGGSFQAQRRVPANASGVTVHFQSAQRGTCPDECLSEVVTQVVQ